MSKVGATIVITSVFVSCLVLTILDAQRLRTEPAPQSQEKPPPPLPDSERDPTAKAADALKAAQEVQAKQAEELMKLRAQISALQKAQQAMAATQKGTTTDQQAKMRSFYREAFRAGRDLAREACQESGGRLWVMVSQNVTGNTTSISCEMK